MMAIYRHGSALTRCGAEIKALTRLVPAQFELTPPPNFFMVVIQQAGNSYPSSRLSLLLVGVFWIGSAQANHISALTSTAPHKLPSFSYLASLLP